MKAILEVKKKELLAQMEQSQTRLREYENAISQTKANINALSGAIQVVDELEREVKSIEEKHEGSND